MKALGRGTIEMTESNKRWYEQNGYTMTGETLVLGNETENCEYVVFRGTWTRHMSVRDCGDHYICAGYSGYDKIDKATLEITKDVERLSIT